MGTNNWNLGYLVFVCAASLIYYLLEVHYDILRGAWQGCLIFGLLCFIWDFYKTYITSGSAALREAVKNFNKGRGPEGPPWRLIC